MGPQTTGDRLVWAHLLTSRGWILGAVRVPRALPLLKHLNAPGNFLQLAQVASGWWRPGKIALWLRKSAVWLVVPGSEERVAPRASRGRGSPHQVTVMLPAGGVSGILDLAPRSRPLAFVERAEPFVVLERCRLRFASTRLPRLGVVRAAIVNARAAVGLSVRLTRPT